MTTNRDELLARMAAHMRRNATGRATIYDDREFVQLLAEYDALPQRPKPKGEIPEGAAVAFLLRGDGYSSPHLTRERAESDARAAFPGEPHEILPLGVIGSPPASAVAEHGEPMSDGQIAYERAFPDRTNRVPFKLLPNWMEHQWHRQAERDKTAQAATVSGFEQWARSANAPSGTPLTGEAVRNFMRAAWDAALASSPAAPAPVESEKECCCCPWCMTTAACNGAGANDEQLRIFALHNSGKHPRDFAEKNHG